MGLRTEENRKRERKKNNNKKKKTRKEGGRGGEKKDRAYCWLQRIHLRIAAYENNTTWSLVTSVASPRFIFQGIALPISSPPPPIFSFFSLPRFRLFHPFCMPEFESRYMQRVVLSFGHYICESWAESLRVVCVSVHKGGGGGIEEGGRKGGRGEIVKRD